ncbi:MAG: DUF1801 domain-containing protein [Alphaproteobacteria bacterium]|nr:DUF1801 domain-containing protein [Alphaproteobacteria bacterium]
MAENKTKATTASVSAFIKSVEHDKRRKDAQTIKKLMDKVTGWKAKMWGPSIVGYGQYHYKYDSGREGDYPITGFSPRKQALTIYIMPGFSAYDGLMAKLGKYKTGRSCLYINKLEDVDIKVLETLIRKSVAFMKKKYGVK